MSVAIVQVGLKHDLPVNDIWKAADILSKRSGRNIHVDSYNKENGCIDDLGEVRVNDKDEVAYLTQNPDSPFEFSIDGSYNFFSNENVNIDIHISNTWYYWISMFYTYDEQSVKYLRDYRLQMFERAKLFGCSEIIICPDQGAGMEVWENMDFSASELKDYAMTSKFLENSCWLNTEEKIETFKKYQRQIYFKDYFARKLSFKKDEFVSLIYDDFEDL